MEKQLKSPLYRNEIIKKKTKKQYTKADAFVDNFHKKRILTKKKI